MSEKSNSCDNKPASVNRGFPRHQKITSQEENRDGREVVARIFRKLLARDFVMRELRQLQHSRFFLLIYSRGDFFFLQAG